MRPRRLGIPAMGVVGPLGIGKLETSRRLFEGSRSGLVLREGLVPERPVYVGAVEVQLACRAATPCDTEQSAHARRP